jgi:hypothetical protein
MADMKYTTTDGKMPPEFHQRHLLGNVERTVKIECNQCGREETYDENTVLIDTPDDTKLRETAAKIFYNDGWRYCELPDYAVEGVFCADCVERDGGVEDNTLQQPYAELSEG